VNVFGSPFLKLAGVVVTRTAHGSLFVEVVDVGEEGVRLLAGASR